MISHSKVLLNINNTQFFKWMNANAHKHGGQQGADMN